MGALRVLNTLEYGLKALLRRDEMNPKTPSKTAGVKARETALLKSAKDLHSLGYKRMTVDQLRQKHVKELTRYWHEIGTNAATIRVRLSAIRWWAKQANCESAIAKENRAYHLGSAVEVEKSLTGDFSEKLSKVTDSWVVMSLRLQASFGLNTMESIKLRPSEADKGYSLEIKKSWSTKHKPIGRTIRFESPLQRAVLDEAKTLANEANGAMISPKRNYIEQYRVYERQLARAGFSREIGARYQYVLWRFERLTGRKAPSEGGRFMASLDALTRRESRRVAGQITNEIPSLDGKIVRAILAGNDPVKASCGT